MQFTAEQEYVDLLEEAFDLLGLAKRAASLPELQLRALRELVERLRQRRTGTKRRVRGPAASADVTDLPTSSGRDAASARALDGHNRAPEREPYPSSGASERELGDSSGATRELKDPDSAPDWDLGDSSSAPAREAPPRRASAAPARALSEASRMPEREFGEANSQPEGELRGSEGVPKREVATPQASAALARDDRALQASAAPARDDVVLQMSAAPARDDVVLQMSAAPARRLVSAAVRCEVWARDAGRCAYTDDRGRRCAETGRLELHHRQAHAFGGPSTVANLELRCPPHNLLAAERDFGRTHMDHRRGKGPASRAGAVR